MRARSANLVLPKLEVDDLVLAQVAAGEILVALKPPPTTPTTITATSARARIPRLARARFRLELGNERQRGAPQEAQALLPR